MFNVIDISNLNLTVGYPNGTLAKITAFRNLRLIGNVVLFDVLVVHEYCVSLLYVYTLIKDSKLFVGFDEHKCYIRDLNMVKIVVTDNASGGLYLFDLERCGKSNVGLSNSAFVCHVSKQWYSRLGHPSNQVLSTLSKSIDWAKSVSGFRVYLYGNLISWKSKKQATISRSSTKTEYRCTTSTTCEIVWLINLLEDLNVDGVLPVPLYCDNTSAIQIVVNLVFYEKTKHFEIDVHLVRERLLLVLSAL
nr:copia protein [Tanacetum cinerariifolium]